MYRPQPPADGDALFEKAASFIRQCYEELDSPEAIEPRLDEIRAAIDETGHYEHTTEELEHGARMAWRNSPRCIGRLFWQSLTVRDRRDVDTAERVHEELCEHLEYARNGGNVRPAITIFPPSIDGADPVRIWNYQLVRYAGYETADGIVGDPDERELTAYCESRGWEGEGTRFDVLPHVIAIEGQEPELFDVPESVVGRVPITHPEYDWFEELDLQWYDVPAVSGMCLEIGGIQYPAAPFSGWYVAPEISARNFADEDRYDLLPTVGDRLGLDTSRPASLWKDEVVVELTRAVLHSYEEAGVKIVDHHTVAEQFEEFEKREQEAGREVAGDWSWLIPPVSPATTQMFHSSYDMTMRSPNIYYQEPPYESITVGSEASSRPDSD